MKWITAVSIAIALVATVALIILLRIGICLPPKLEDMTMEDGALPAISHNLNIILFNQTRREIGIRALLDGRVSFGGAMIRDQHFGTAALGIDVDPGQHTLEIQISGRPPTTKSFTLSTKGNTTNHVAISIFGDAKTGYRFDVKTSEKSFGMM